jgi:ribose 1,5-bisphosphokinase PhnN
MKSWVLNIAGALVVSAIGAIVAVSFTSGKVDAAQEVRVHHIERRLDGHDAQIKELAEMRVLLERIDQRSGDMKDDVARRLDRVEQKLEAPTRRQR